MCTCLEAKFNEPSAPTEVWNRSTAIADELLLLPYEPQQSRLTELKNSDPVMHALVTRHLDKARGLP